MRKATLKVFDDFLPPGSDTLGVYSGADADLILGKHDALALHVITDETSGSGTLIVSVQQSHDGRDWFNRDGTPVDGGTILTTFSSAFTSAISQTVWSDAALGVSQNNGRGTGVNGPLMPYVRLFLRLATSAESAHVQIFATQRDM
jgi:hypothetical protein